MEWTDEPRRGRAFIRIALLLMIGLLVLGPALARPVGASFAPPGTAAVPDIGACVVYPDPRIESPSACGDTSTPAFVNSTVRFNVSVSDPEGEGMNVTFYFDRLLPGGSTNLNSSTVRIEVLAPGPGVTAYAETNWTYTRLSNFTNGNYWVLIEARDADGEVGSQGPFPLFVTENTAPSMDGLLSTYSGSVDYPDPQVPLIYVNVSVGDIDDDPITVTWEWGDGTVGVDSAPPFTNLFVTHQYDKALFPLNETPRIVRFPIKVWVDDGFEGHNTSLPSSAEFDLEFDSPPNVQVNSPSVGSRFKVGEPVLMQGTATDPEGDPVVTYWDFDVATDSDGDGDPTQDRDAPGPEATHAYDAPGDYNVAFWASDGETKKRCTDDNCSNSITHWRKQEVPITVRLNQLPVIALANHTALVNEPVLLRIAILDADGDSLLVTWDFGDGSANATNQTLEVGTVEFFQEHVYTTPSLCPGVPARLCPTNLTVTVFDGTDTVVDVKVVYVESFNLPPVIRSLTVLRENRTAAPNSTFLYNTTAVLRLNMTDAEDDPINVTISWGDGDTATARVTLVTVDNTTSVAVEGDADECTLNPEGHIVCYFSHVYGDIGDAELRGYPISVTITDGRVYADIDPVNGTLTTISHTIRDSATVQIQHPRLHGLGPWDGWDFSTLAVVLGLPGFLVGRAAWRIHREREEE
ncbi:MAG TPA: PKD domain-containing protein [Thermoplasmata archaeon]|nr:PKD domain-containing protein [Thermoplasmata archaeon]